MAWHTRLLTSPYLPIVTSGWLPTASKRCVWLTFALSSVDSWDTLSPTEFVFTVHKVLLQSNSLAPCKVIHIPESRKFRILGFGIRNLAQGVRNRISADKNSVIRNPQRRIPNLTLSQITLHGARWQPDKIIVNRMKWLLQFSNQTSLVATSNEMHSRSQEFL